MQHGDREEQHLSNALWAAARLKEGSWGLDLEAEAAPRLQAMETQGFTNCVWASSALGSGVLLARGEALLPAWPGALLPQEVACLSWAFTVLGPPAEAPLLELRDRGRAATGWDPAALLLLRESCWVLHPALRSVPAPRTWSRAFARNAAAFAGLRGA